MFGGVFGRPSSRPQSRSLLPREKQGVNSFRETGTSASKRLARATNRPLWIGAIIASWPLKNQQPDKHFKPRVATDAKTPGAWCHVGLDSLHSEELPTLCGSCIDERFKLFCDDRIAVLLGNLRGERDDSVLHNIKIDGEFFELIRSFREKQFPWVGSSGAIRKIEPV